MSNDKKEYDFGGIEEFTLEEIENEILMDATYLDIFAGCDIRLKKNIESVNTTDALSTICQMQTIKFDYTEDAIKNKRQPKNRQVGVIAQEAAQFCPESVAKDSEGNLFVNYKEMIPLLVSSIQELNKVVESQQKIIEELNKKNS